MLGHLPKVKRRFPPQYCAVQVPGIYTRAIARSKGHDMPMSIEGHPWECALIPCSWIKHLERSLEVHLTPDLDSCSRRARFACDKADLFKLYTRFPTSTQSTQGHHMSTPSPHYVIWLSRLRVLCFQHQHRAIRQAQSMHCADLQQSLMYPTEVVDASRLLITILHRVKRNGAVLTVLVSTKTSYGGANCDPYRVRHLHSTVHTAQSPKQTTTIREM